MTFAILLHALKRRALNVGMALAVFTIVLTPLAAHLVRHSSVDDQALAASDASKVYDDKLMRLAEILGALHYLRAVCGAEDGQKWRTAVAELIKSEGTTALRKAIIARRFNRGYRGYSRTYRNCTTSAQTTIKRFFAEAVTLSDQLLELAK